MSTNGWNETGCICEADRWLLDENQVAQCVHADAGAVPDHSRNGWIRMRA